MASPHNVVMEKSGANYELVRVLTVNSFDYYILIAADKNVSYLTTSYAGLENINMLLMLVGLISFIEIYQVKYLNNLIEQDHRFIKKITKPIMGVNAFHSAKATIDGIETAHMIRNGQLSDENIPAYKQLWL